jgi:AraC-like DNA-binding protein
MNGLLSYVDENFTCPELNVASIAEALGLNPSYLSREVKRCTGMGLLDLLQKKRLDRAVALLAAGHSLTDAARLSGFGNLRALRRAMKRYQEESL